MRLRWLRSTGPLIGDRGEDTHWGNGARERRAEHPTRVAPVEAWPSSVPWVSDSSEWFLLNQDNR
jgi:hypothetical protein